MRISKTNKDEKCRRNAHLKKLSQESCVKNTAAKDLKYQKGKNINVTPAIKLRHTVCEENNKQNFYRRSLSRKVNCFSREVSESLDNQYEVKSFVDFKERELEIQDQEKCDLICNSFRKAQVRLDFNEKHESEKLKSLLSSCQKTKHPGKLKDLDWMFQYKPASPAQQDQIVNMMYSSETTDLDIDLHVQPRNILQDSGFQGSNAPTDLEEAQENTTDLEIARREFCLMYVGGSEDSHTEMIGDVHALGDDREGRDEEEVETAKEGDIEHMVEGVSVDDIEDDLPTVVQRALPGTSDDQEGPASTNGNISVWTPPADHVQGQSQVNNLEGHYRTLTWTSDDQEGPAASTNGSTSVQTPPADRVQGQPQLHNLDGHYIDMHDSNPHKVDFLTTPRQNQGLILDANSLTVDGLTESDDEDGHLSDFDPIVNDNENEVQNFHAAADPLSSVGAVALNMCGIESRSTQVPPQLRDISQGIQEGLTNPAQPGPTTIAQIRPTQGVEARSVQDTQARQTNALRGSSHEGQMTSLILEAGNQELMLQQCMQRVTGGNRHLAKQFLSHLKTVTLLSQHCGVIVCRALQTVLGRGEGGKFRSGDGGQYIEIAEKGQGGYGTVTLCEVVIINGDRLESVKFARKRIPIRRFRVQEAGLYIDYGQILHWMLDFKGILRDGDNVDLFFQYAEGGSLLQWIEKLPNLNNVDNTSTGIVYNQIVAITYQLLRCTSDLNRLKIAHCDIKAGNVLFTSEGCQGSSVVLTDMGTAKVWMDLQLRGVKHLDGTPIFFPPEIEEVFCVNVDEFLDLELVDAWNAGATIYHVLTGHHLWVDEKQELRRKYGENWLKHMREFILYDGWHVCELINRIDQSQHPLITPLVLVISHLLEYDACLRRTATEVLDLPVFSGLRQQQIPCCAAGLCEPPEGDVAITAPQCRTGMSRQFPENPYAKVVVFYENTPIYLHYFERRQGLHLQRLSDNAGFRSQLDLHVPNYQDSYIDLSCHSRDTVSGELVLMNGGTIYNNTYVYLTTRSQSS